MLDIIIYSNNITTIKKSDKAINLALVNYEFDYNIHIINDIKEFKDINSISNKKIYIIDVLNKDSLSIASMIRDDDFNSIIILVNVTSDNYDNLLNKRLMVLDYVIKNNKYVDRLKDDIDLSLRIVYSEEVFVFKYNHVIYRIPYKDINYIEKEPLVKRCIIHTRDDMYYIISSIENMVGELNCNFIRTHQSCIININNVSELDLSNNLIIFKNNDYTSLLTDKMKKKLKKCVRS